MAEGKMTFHPLQLFFAIGDGEINGDDAKVAAAMLVDTVPLLQDAASVPEVIDTARRVCGDPALRDALVRLLETTEATGSMTVVVSDE